MELLIIKTKDTYIRVKEDGFLIVGLDKASVFPMENLEKVRTYEARLKTEGYSDITIKKLVLTEEDLK